MGNNQIDYGWQRNAACASMSAENYDKFYAILGRTSKKGIESVCNRCPVYEECLQHALKYEEFGYWARTTAKERVKMRKELGIKLVDIDYEAMLEYAEYMTKQKVVIRSYMTKRGPKGPRKKKVECDSELESLSQY